MRKLYFYSLTLLCLFLTFSPSARGQEVDHTLVKLFNNTPDLAEIIVDLPVPVVVETWESPNVRTTLNVHIAGLTDEVFKALLVAGRYRTVGNRQGCTYVLSAPELNKELFLNGRSVAEDLTITIKVPRGVTVRLKSDLALATDTDVAQN